MPEYKGYFRLGSSEKEKEMETSTKIMKFTGSFQPDTNNISNFGRLANLTAGHAGTIWDDYKFHPAKSRKAVKQSLKLVQSPQYKLLPGDMKTALVNMLKFWKVIMNSKFEKHKQFKKLVEHYQL